MIHDKQGSVQQELEFPTRPDGKLDWTAHYHRYENLEKIQLHRDEVTWLRNYTKPDEPVDVVLNFGCGIQGIPHLMKLKTAILDKLGIDYVAVAGVKYCCGRVLGEENLTDTGQRVADRAMDRFESWRPKQLVQCCGSCLREFNDQIAARAEQRDGQAPFEDVYFPGFLLDKLIEMGDDVPWKKSVPRRVMVHGEGLEKHITKLQARNDTIATLELIPGVEFVGLVEDPSFGRPCAWKGPTQGSILDDLTPDEYLQVQAELQAQADALGADMIVTQHFTCTQEWSMFASDKLPVLHYQHLLAEALDINIPDRWQMMLRIKDPEEILEYSRPRWESWNMSEEVARETIQRYLQPEYTSQITPCPCGGRCDEAAPGSPIAEDCGRSWANIMTAGQQLPIVDL